MDGSIHKQASAKNLDHSGDGGQNPGAVARAQNESSRVGWILTFGLAMALAFGSGGIGVIVLPFWIVFFCGLPLQHQWQLKRELLICLMGND